MDYKIPFNLPCLIGKELDYIQESIENRHVSGDGIFTKRCHALLEADLNVLKVFLTTSCTHSLEISAILLDLKPEDEVIIPSYTFVSTVNAFVLHGASPVFIDIRPDTLNLDETKLEQLITPRTRAIIPVHYAGVGCEMDTITKIADRHGLEIIEDNAHGLYGKYKGKYLGTFGCMATQSFHETKNFICGEGGALLINDSKWIERAEIIREKGTNRGSFFRGEVDKYTWVDLGSSYLPSDILAAFLYAQLEAKEEIQLKRKRIWKHYEKKLKNWAQDHQVKLPCVPEYCEQPNHLFYLILPSPEKRQLLIDHLKSKSILSVSHYMPLHLSKMGQQFGGKPGDCPISEDLSNRLLRLPFYNQLTQTDQDKVIQTILECPNVAV